MYKRDYELIAATIKGEIADVDAKMQDPMEDAVHAHYRGMRDGYHKLAYSLAEKFRLDNPLFHPTKFITACGVK